MAYSWNDPDTRDFWTLTIDESALLPGVTDKGRLGFAAQLKFMQLQGRFPERHDEIDPSAAQWLAAQLGTTAEALSSYELCGRQGQRHRRTIRDFLGFRRATGAELQQLVQWLYDDVFPFDPQARHGHDMALDWCRTQRLEPPAGDHLDRVIRSAMHGYETQQQAAIPSRLSAHPKTAIDRLLASENPDEAHSEESAAISFSNLKTDPILARPISPSSSASTRSAWRQRCFRMFPPNSSNNSGSVARRSRFANYGATQTRSATAWWPCSAGGVSNS